MFIPRTLLTDTSIATSSHSLLPSSLSFGSSSFNKSSGDTTASSQSTASKSQPASAIFTSVRSTNTVGSAFLTSPSLQKLTSSTTAASHVSGNSLVSTSVASANTIGSAFETAPPSPDMTSSTIGTSNTSRSFSLPSSFQPDSQQPTTTAESASRRVSLAAANAISIQISNANGASSTPTKPGPFVATASVSESKVQSPTSTSASSTNSPSENNFTSHSSRASAATSNTNSGPTSTSRTHQPFSTFSMPVSVTLTNSAGGSKVVTVPPLVTSVGTSTDSNGSRITYTHVIANPTGTFSNTHGINPSSFLRKPSQVIPMCLGVGIVLAALIGCITFILLRHWRRKRHEHTRVSIRWPPTDSGVSFADIPEVPSMRTISIDVQKKPGVVWKSGPRSTGDLSFNSSSRPASAYTAYEAGRAGIEKGAISVDERGSPFGDLYGLSERRESTVGLAVTTGQDLIRIRTHSLTPSTPSMYPESVVTANEDADSLYKREMGMTAQGSCIEMPRASGHWSLTPPTSISSGSSPASTIIK